MIISIIISVFAGILIGASLTLLMVFQAKGSKSRNRALRSGDSLVGSYALVSADIIPDGPLGKVEVHGTIWNAEGFEYIPKGTRVIIAGHDNLTLLVEKA